MLFLIMLIIIYKCSVFNVSPNPQFKVTGKSYGDVIGAEEGSTPPDSPIFITLSFFLFSLTILYIFSYKKHQD